MRDVLISVSREFQGKVNTHVAFSIVRAYECEKYMFYVIQNYLLYVYNGTAPGNRIFSSRDSVIIHCREEGCIGKYPPPPPPRFERFTEAGILHPEGQEVKNSYWGKSRGLREVYFPIHPYSSQCIDILFSRGRCRKLRPKWLGSIDSNKFNTHKNVKY